MSFTVTHIDGAMEANPPAGWQERLLAELALADIEHGDVSVGHESGWTLSVSRNSRVLWENVEDDGVVARAVRLEHRQVVEAFGLLAQGRIEDVASIIASQASN